MNNRNQSDINLILQTGYSVETGEFIKRGWEICQSNLGLFIGFFLITILISGALVVINVLIPGVGNAVSIVISGPLNAGNIIAAFKIIKGRSISFSDFFRGFQGGYFLPIMLTTLVMGLLVLLCFIPVVVVTAIVSVTAQTERPTESLIVLAILLAILGLICAIYLSVAYIFAIPLIIGRKMEFWPAMEASRKLVGQQWFNVFGFISVLGLINFGGFLACGVGLFITVPLTTCAIAAAYDHIIGLPSADDSFA